MDIALSILKMAITFLAPPEGVAKPAIEHEKATANTSAIISLGLLRRSVLSAIVSTMGSIIAATL